MKKHILKALDSLTIGSVDCGFIDEGLGFYNYKAGKYEHPNGKINDEKAMQFIPQDQVAQEIYKACRQKGKSELDAIAEVFDYVLGKLN